MDPRRIFRCPPTICWAIFVIGALIVVPGGAITVTGESAKVKKHVGSEAAGNEAPRTERDAEELELTQSATNLRAIMKAIHAYHKAAGHYPTAHAGLGFDKKTRKWYRHRSHLSWRVLLLPFLGERELFDKFRMMEPWDSEHNKKLISQMPDVYRTPGSDATSGMTNYLGVVGPNAGFSVEKPITVIDIPDGTVQTIMLVEAPDKWAVEWTRPRDFPANTENPNKELASLRKGGFLTAFGDGSTAVISEDVPPDVLNGLIIRNDRAILDDMDKWIRRVPPTAKPR